MVQLKIMEKLKTWSDVIGTWVTIIGALTGGGFALVQYTDQIASARVQETLKYVERFSSDPLQKASMHLDAFWNPRAEEVFNKSAEGETVLFKYLNSAIRDNHNHLEGDTNRLLAFYETLRTCTCAKLCDNESTVKFFGKQAFDSYGILFPYISSQRDRLKDNSFGTGMESLAKNYRNKEKYAYCPIS